MGQIEPGLDTLSNSVPNFTLFICYTGFVEEIRVKEAKFNSLMGVDGNAENQTDMSYRMLAAGVLLFGGRILPAIEKVDLAGI